MVWVLIKLIIDDEINTNQRNLNISAIIWFYLNQTEPNVKETDYIAIKFAEGEMTAEEFAPYKEQRHAWRQRINELEKE